MKNNRFSLLVYESTDVGTIKHLAMVVRIMIDWDIKDLFLTLIPLEDATAKNIHHVIKQFFDNHKIPYTKNCIGPNLTCRRC